MRNVKPLPRLGENGNGVPGRAGAGDRPRSTDCDARAQVAREATLAYLDRIDAECGPVPDEIASEVAALPRPE